MKLKTELYQCKNLSINISILTRKINIFKLILIFFIFYGLICKLLIALNLSLNSDDVQAGLVSLEVWRHKNYFLVSYYFPSPDPYWFSDIFPFHLVPQIISNFSPLVLKFVSYIIFVLIILLYSFLVLKISKNTCSALIFSALLANLYPGSSRFFLLPTFHNATIFFVGLFMFVFLDFRYKLNLKYLGSLLLLLLILFSDSLIILWFIIPLFFCYIYRYKNKSDESNLLIILMILGTGIIYVYKVYFISNFISWNFHANDLGAALGINLPLYIEGLSVLLFGTSYAAKPMIYIYFVAIFIYLYFIIVGYFSNEKIISTFLVFSMLLMLNIYIFTNLGVDLLTTRYLTFSAITIYILVSASSQQNKIFQIIFVIFILSLSAISNFLFISHLDYCPNKNESDLINYLTDNNLEIGYADYWDSNIITYLSNEKIFVRSIASDYNENDIVPYSGDIYLLKGFEPFRWLSCEMWYNQKANLYQDYFILIRRDTYLKRESVIQRAKFIDPRNILQFGEYTIYVFNRSYPVNVENYSWYGLQEWNGIPMRWMKDNATILIISSENRSANLSLKVLSFYHNRTLEISCDDTLAAQTAVPASFTNMSAPVNLVRGVNTVRLYVPESCERPSDKLELHNSDSRCLSVGIQNITVN